MATGADDLVRLIACFSDDIFQYYLWSVEGDRRVMSCLCGQVSGLLPLSLLQPGA